MEPRTQRPLRFPIDKTTFWGTLLFATLALGGAYLGMLEDPEAAYFVPSGLGLAVFILVTGFQGCRAIARWEEEHGVIVLKREMRTLKKGPYSDREFRNHVVFWVRYIDRDGNRRSEYFCLGHNASVLFGGGRITNRES